MKILIAGEFSGIVREAFKKRDHDAWSCDLLDTEIPGNHIQGDVLKILNDGWDLMIAFPPCTYFAAPGMHYLKTKPERKDQLKESFRFWLELWSAPIMKIAMENPIGWLNTNWRKPNQIIQPYYFGDDELKTTCLWLKSLPRLNGDLAIAIDYKNLKPKPKGFHNMADGRKKNTYWINGKTAHQKSKTFLGIAKAMAEQWG